VLAQRLVREARRARFAPSLSGDERVEAKAALEKFDRAGLEVFQLILRREERRRASRAS